MTISLEDYTLNFNGTSFTDEEAFTRYKDLAFDVINYYTNDRIPEEFEKLEEQEPTVAKKVVRCLYSIMDRMVVHDTNYSDGISSESTDGHSVSFEKLSEASKKKELYSICRRYIGSTGLMYSAHNPYWDNRTW